MSDQRKNSKDFQDAIDWFKKFQHDSFGIDTLQGQKNDSLPWGNYKLNSKGEIVSQDANETGDDDYKSPWIGYTPHWRREDLPVDTPKCSCGSHKVYGNTIDISMHQDYCDLRNKK